MTGQIEHGPAQLALFTYTGPAPRLVTHYTNAFRDLFHEGEHFGLDEHIRLYRLLYQQPLTH